VSGAAAQVYQPAFGEDDYNVCISNNIISRDGSDMPFPLDANGRFLAEVTDYAGLYIKDADKQIIKDLKTRGVMLMSESEVHAVKTCPRSDTPLIYRAVPSWFIQVDGHNEKLVRQNEQIRWVPNHVKEGRFKNWLADAKDWCVSRNRFWGTPIPLWVNEDFSEIRCVGSVAELEAEGVRFSPTDEGRKVESLADIHRHFIDDIRLPSVRNPGTYLRRIDEVFDCWFESGSMPYGQIHYPFDATRAAALSDSADFIAEGLDQTRGWFYTVCATRS
jgi:isoleucyl-tRNA synthetase